uniref:Folliculin-interacting protein C-terminal domain-containing protein n=1 Tax=Ditylenchus dipsaci TaxID=166011 RepID=A0A915DJV6_9BILA
MYTSIHEDIKHPTGEPCSSANSQLLSPSTSNIVGLSLGSDAGPSSQGNNGFANAAIYHSSNTNSAVPAPPTIVSSHRSSHESTAAPNKPDEKLHAVIVVADCADYVVKIVSSENCHIKDTEVVCPSEAIASMLEEFVELYKHGCASTFLISFIEDRLGSLLAKSNVLVQLVSSSSTDEKLCDSLTKTSKNVCQNKNSQDVDMKTEEMDNVAAGSLSDSSISGIACNYNNSPQQPDQTSIGNREEEDKNNEIISTDHVSNILGCHCSDLRLILNVAAVYSPVVLSSVV